MEGEDENASGLGAVVGKFIFVKCEGERKEEQLSHCAVDQVGMVHDEV